MPTHQGKTQTDIQVARMSGDYTLPLLGSGIVSPEHLVATGSVADNIVAHLSIAAAQSHTREHILLSRQVGVPAAAKPQYGPVITIKPKGYAAPSTPVIISKPTGGNPPPD